jgi:uncharacterized membrane protein YgdD (TMEM256/DUF423 family)
VIAALLGASGVAAAAYGAHGLEKIASPEQIRWWAIAVALQLVTAPAILVLGLLHTRVRPACGWLLFAGVLVFSGSLYAMALGGPRVLGAVTPLGGLLLILAWAMVAIRSAD